MKNRIYWFLSKLVRSYIREKGFVITAGFCDVALTYFVYIGRNWSRRNSALRVEIGALKQDIRRWK